MMEEVLGDQVQKLILAHMSRTNNDPRAVTLQMKLFLKRMGLTTPFVIAEQDEPMDTVVV